MDLKQKDKAAVRMNRRFSYKPVFTENVRKYKVMFAKWFFTALSVQRRGVKVGKIGAGFFANTAQASLIKRCPESGFFQKIHKGA